MLSISVPQSAGLTSAAQRRHHLVGHQPNDFLHVFRLAWLAICAGRLALAGVLVPLAIAAAECVVAAQVAILSLVEAGVVVAKFLFQIEQLLRLMIREVIHIAELLR